MCPLCFSGHINNLYSKPFRSRKISDQPKLIAWATAFGTLQGIAITLNLNRQWVLRLCRKLNLSVRFGDEDVWTLLLNSTVTDNYATIRHKEQGLVYQGYVSGFSSGGEKRELLLIKVEVFAVDETDPARLTQVGDIAFLYLAFEEANVTLEFGLPPDNSVPP